MITPAGHKVLVRPKAVEKTSAGGIVLAINEERELAATVEGEVVKLGDTAYLKVDDGRKWCKEGDKVLYAKYAGHMVKDPTTGEDFVVVHDVDIVCIIS